MPEIKIKDFVKNTIKKFDEEGPSQELKNILYSNLIQQNMRHRSIIFEAFLREDELLDSHILSVTACSIDHEESGTFNSYIENHMQRVHQSLSSITSKQQLEDNLSEEDLEEWHACNIQMRNIGLLYFNGIYINNSGQRKLILTSNMQKAVEAFTLATDPKVPCPLSEYYLGLIYKEGKGGIEPDPHTAKEHFEKSGNEGYPRAIYELGEIARLEGNIPHANYLYRKAAAKNVSEAAIRLGENLEKNSRKRSLDAIYAENIRPSYPEPKRFAGFTPTDENTPVSYTNICNQLAPPPQAQVFNSLTPSPVTEEINTQLLKKQNKNLKKDKENLERTVEQLNWQLDTRRDQLSAKNAEITSLRIQYNLLLEEYKKLEKRLKKPASSPSPDNECPTPETPGTTAIRNSLYS